MSLTGHLICAIARYKHAMIIKLQTDAISYRWSVFYMDTITQTLCKISTSAEPI